MAIARCEEAVESEKLHFEAYQKAWEEVETYKGRRVLQLYVCDGSDWIKKFGLGSFSARQPLLSPMPCEKRSHEVPALA